LQHSSWLRYVVTVRQIFEVHRVQILDVPFRTGIPACDPLTQKGIVLREEPEALKLES